MTDGLDEIQRQATKAHLQATIEEQFKSVGYLLVAHGGGLVSCVTFLKEKSTIPGVQLFTSLFAYGFLTAIFAYGFTALVAQEARLLFINSGISRNRVMLTLRVSLIFVAISSLLLMSAVILIAQRLGVF